MTISDIAMELQEKVHRENESEDGKELKKREIFRDFKLESGVVSSNGNRDARENGNDSILAEA